MNRKMRKKIHHHHQHTKFRWSDASLTNQRRIITPLLTFQKDPNCSLCQRCKFARAPCRRQRRHQGKPDDTPVPNHFGDSITADHTFTATDEPSRKGETVAPVIQDRASHWIQAFASKTKSAHETGQVFQRLMGGFKSKLTYTDGSNKFEKHAKTSVIAMTCLPHTAPKQTVWRKELSVESKKVLRAHLTNPV